MKTVLLSLLLLICLSTQVETTTYSGYDWDHSGGNYLGTYLFHRAWYPIGGWDGWIVVYIRCKPSNKVCFNIYNQELNINDDWETCLQSLDDEGDYDEYTIEGTR
jgi:hypothetical protein